ncbi:HEAT repeat domain-containing protein [Maribacter sp. X9]|uniref:HEAT repeat domain-containing protein n=1 Tax=Maribacter sp. X9 TaxID=3402159 RepID=UPI003AF38139
MNFLTEQFEGLPSILQINLMLSICFITLALMLLGLVLYLRMYKNINMAVKEKLEAQIQDFINNYIFDDDFNKSNPSRNFKRKYLKNRYALKIMMKQVLIFNQNFKGESSIYIKEIFFDLGLDLFLISDLRTKSWFKKARALFALRQLDVKIPDSIVKPLINSKRAELRQQAILYLLNQSHHNPLEFLDQINIPLTLWEQIYIEDALKAYEGEIPDFSRWLVHDITSVVVFCLKMIVDHNQYASTPEMLKLLQHKDVEIRQQTIIALKKLEVYEAVPSLIENFSHETILIKQEILKAIAEMGSEKELEVLGSLIAEEELIIKRDYHKITGHAIEERSIKEGITGINPSTYTDGFVPKFTL